MTEGLLRLAWALPAVLAVGVLLMLLLRRFTGSMPVESQSRRLHLRDSLTVSDETRVHLLEVDGKPHVLVESSRRADLTVLHSVPSAGLVQAARVSRTPIRNVPRWLQRLAGVQQR